LKILALICVALGTTLLGLSLFPTRKICHQQHQSSTTWRILGILILLFTCGYLAFGVFLLTSEITRMSFLVSLILLGGGLFVAMVVHLTDNSISQITDMVKAERHRSLHDELTELPNRHYLHERIDQIIGRDRHHKESLAIFLIDINSFREINNALGHFYADFLLQKVAIRLLEPLRVKDTLARWSGDKFALLLPETGRDQAVAVARQMTASMTRPFLIEGQSLVVNISIGMVFYPEHGSETDVLLQYADIAMYDAHRNQVDYSIFEPLQTRDSWSRLLMAGELRRAIDNREMLLYYQPQISVVTGRLSGVEALVRWQHRDRGLILPGEFIEIVEQQGLINALTGQVLDQGLNQLHLWREQGMIIDLSVNLSVKNLHDLEFPGIAEGLLRKWQIDPSRITLEITESSIMLDPGRVARVVASLKELGFQLAIDDFGTGYSSLAYLRKFPARQIKIDKSFVLDMLTNEDSAVIVKSTIDMAHNIGRQVVAEGVENHDTQVLLKRLGCDFLQGFHISRPLSADDFQIWYHGQQKRTSSVQPERAP
jgi:diguanylate cyclase (GGDEF)-like protein